MASAESKSKAPVESSSAPSGAVDINGGVNDAGDGLLHIRGEGISVSVTARQSERVLNDLLRRNVASADDVLASLRNISNYGNVTNRAPASASPAPSPSSCQAHPPPRSSPSSSPKKKPKKCGGGGGGGDDDGTAERKRRALFATCRRRHVAIRLLYDGSSFPNGFAQNVGVSGPGDETVERHLFDALTRTCLVEDRASAGYNRCGRTDAGVSAFGQVVSLRLRSAIPKLDARGEVIGDAELPRNNFDTVRVWAKTKKHHHKKSHGKRRKGSSDRTTDGATEEEGVELKDVREMDYCRILNSVLNDTPLRAVGWAPVTEDFSARFSATSRTYRYFFVRRDLDLEAMRRGLARVVGRHDFRNLCKMDAEAVSNFERVIAEARVVTSPDDDGTGSGDEDEGEGGGGDPGRSHRRRRLRRHLQVCHIEITGQAFLWHMVRCIAAVSFLVGKRREDPTGVVLDDLLDVVRNPAKPSYKMADERPLVLHRCDYANLTFGHSARNLWEVTCYLEARWEEMTLAAARMRNAIDGLQEEASVRVDDVAEFVRECFLRPARERREKAKAREGRQGRTVDAGGGGGGELDVQALEEKLEALLRPSSGTQKGTVGGTAAEGGNEVPAGEGSGNGGVIPWGEALRRLEEAGGFVPSPSASEDYRSSSPYVGLMDRSKGMTYEDKVRAMKGRKRGRYEEKMKKRQSKEEDEQFYERMSKQGGTGI